MSKILKFNEYISEGVYIPKITLDYKPKEIVQLITEMELDNGKKDATVMLPICKDENFPTVLMAKGHVDNSTSILYWFAYSTRADEETKQAFNGVMKEIVGDTFCTENDVKKGKLEEVLNRLIGIKTAKKGKKVYRITQTKSRMFGKDSVYTHEGTLEELIQYYKYTLETGQSYEHEKGNKKINTNPKNIESLVKNLYNASNNAAANGYSGCFYEYEEI